MKISCEIIRDLLPLYHDGVCSSESKQLIEEHLAVCRDCQEKSDMENARLELSRTEQDDDTSLKALAYAWKKGKTKALIKGIAIALSSVIVLIILFNICFSLQKNEGRSMEPTLSSGSLCLFSKIGTDQAAHGDIIWVSVDIDGPIGTINDIVRIIGIPGDSIKIENGTLYVNGEASKLYQAGQVLAGDITGEVVLGENEYFVMGDNQKHSTDSRSDKYGTITLNNICGLYIFKLS